jgi:hypothetical protein
MQDVYADADADGRFVEDAFFERFMSHLEDAGEVDSASRAFFTHGASTAKGIRVDGYGGDPEDSEGRLTLFISDFSQEEAPESLTQSEINKLFPRLRNFVTSALDPSFRNALEESSPAFSLSSLIAIRWPSVNSVRLVIISNRNLSTVAKGVDTVTMLDRPFTHVVWDIGRLHRYVLSGRERDNIEIDFHSSYGPPLAALPAHLNNDEYEAYLAVLSGEQLARIYGRWNAQLLEQNVRTFLQARGNVNKGIRNTLENSPEMFFAYNNGITATATSITTQHSEQGLTISAIENLQIVNGGQTTASIYAASRLKDHRLADVAVQMKLSVIRPELSETVVPKISEYANSQNRVNAADFFSNHPFHIRMEQFSRRVYAPAPDGAFRESKWFYERARGQYLDQKSGLTQAQQKKFELEYPRNQLFSKTDLAKYQNSWGQLPHVVSQGAQKNFAAFAGDVGKEWDRQSDQFNEEFYRDAIAKAILFKQTEKLVDKQPWYGGGYRANIVTYAIAKLAREIARAGETLDSDRIWRPQALTEGIREALEVTAKAAHDVLIDPPTSGMNVTEWAKKELCWTRLSGTPLALPDSLRKDLKSHEAQRERKRDAVKKQKLTNDLEAQIKVYRAGAKIWSEVLEWGTSRKLLSADEISILGMATDPTKLLSDRQSNRVLTALYRMQEEGCTITLE